MVLDDSPIVAISSGLKNAAIGVIRASGKGILEIVSKIFKPFKQKVDLVNSKGYKVYYGTLISQDGEVIDEVILTVFRAPKSYTGEDMVEISCHGNVILMQKIVNILISLGCRMALGGEFTLRAVLNKKIDLTKAFAIRDVIESTSEQMLKLSLKNMLGYFSNKISYIKERLLYWVVWLEAALDFPEEDIPVLNLQDLKNDLLNLIAFIEKIISSYDVSKMYREGIDSVIVGKPNVGKSTFFNYLYGYERVIISDIPGTTRDIISEYINLDGVILKLYDTAGFRKTYDIIEKIGIEKAKEIITKSQLVFWVLEYPSFDEDDLQAINFIQPYQKVLIIINKIDKADKDFKIAEFSNFVRKYFEDNFSSKVQKFDIVECSFKENLNLERLKEKIYDLVGLSEDVVLIDSFQYEVLKEVKLILQKTLDDFHFSIDVLVINLREALKKITQLTGEDLSDLVIDSMLNRFCIGK